MTRYCYSLDGEEFHGDYETRGDALANGEHEARCSGDFDPGPATIYTAEVMSAMECLRRQHTASIGERVVEMLNERLCDEISSDDDIIELDAGAQAGLGTAILSYLEAHAKFTRFGVKNTQQHAITIPENE